MEFNPAIIIVLVFIVILYSQKIKKKADVSKAVDKAKDEKKEVEMSGTALNVNPQGLNVTKIRLESAKAITISEVAMTDKSGNAINMEGVIHTSTLYAWSAPATVLTDGVTGGNFYAAEIAHTLDDGWVEITLATPVKFSDINTIQISNRTDCCQEVIVGTNVLLCSGNKELFKYTIETPHQLIKINVTH